MNRIYQGRVSKVEIFNGKNADGQPLDINVLWRHHELFQDAVNYYLICLLCLATDPQSEIGKLREQITKDGGDASGWTSFRNQGVTRRGLQKFVAQYLTPKNDSCNFEQIAAAVLPGNGMAATDERRATPRAEFNN